MENAISKFKQLPETKAEITEFARQVVGFIKDGNGNPIELSAQLKAVEEAVKVIRKGICDVALEEVAKYGKNHETANAKFTTAMSGVKYDFSNCQDPVWNQINEVMTKLKESQKERETFLKGIKGQLTIAVEETGEVVTIFEPKKTGTETLKITLK